MFLKYAKKSVKYAVSMVIGSYHEMNQVWQRLAGQLSESFDSAIFVIQKLGGRIKLFTFCFLMISNSESWLKKKLKKFKPFFVNFVNF